MPRKAAKPRADSAVLFIRMTPDVRRRLVAKARRGGRSLTDWARRALLAAPEAV